MLARRERTWFGEQMMLKTQSNLERGCECIHSTKSVEYRKMVGIVVVGRVLVKCEELRGGQ